MSFKSLQFWPHGLTIMIVFFVVMTVVFTLRLANEKIHLVEPDYYAQELKYQERIDRMKRTNALENGILFGYNASMDTMTFQYPQEFEPGSIEGTISFFRPSNPELDLNISIAADSLHKQRVYTGGLERGFWKAKILWESGEQTFYNEFSLIFRERGGNF